MQLVLNKNAELERARAEFQRVEEEKASKFAKRSSHEELHDVLYPIRWNEATSLIRTL